MDNIANGFLITESGRRILFSMLMALILGIIMSASYCFSSKEKRVSKHFVLTVLLLPVIMAVIIPYVATDLKKTLSLAGVFALVRFRSIPGDSRDILFVFFAAAAGLVVGLQEYFIGFALVIFVGALFCLLSRFWKTNQTQILKITIPEDMNYKNVFDDVFSRFLKKWSVKNVKTSNMGSLFTISYFIEPKAEFDSKAFIDEVRTRNGNLNVILENPDDLLSSVL